MSTRKTNKHWGGKRKNAGRKKGERERMKICVSVDAENWQSALSRWNDKGSWLVDWLLKRFLQGKGSR